MRSRHRASHAERRRAGSWWALLLVAMVWGAWAPRPAQAAPAAPALGAACADCHEAQVTQFALTGHGKSFRHAAGYAEAGCQSCHGEATKHLESNEASDIANPARAKGGAADAACQTCHANQKGHTLWAGSEHETAAVRCVDCHAVHGGTPEKRGTLRTSSDLCLSCHKKQQVAMAKRFRHPLAEDKVSCASCHNAHGANEAHLVKGDSVNDLCLSCHAEKRGPFLWEHSPVREDCLTCHQAHGSNHEGMLVSRTTQLCQSCHLQGRHQSVAGLDTAMWNTNRGCVNCHAQIHGSNHPSGPLFQR
jgi:DmsE family decaheme c-type cytochrome